MSERESERERERGRDRVKGTAAPQRGWLQPTVITEVAFWDRKTKRLKLGRQQSRAGTEAAPKMED